MIIILLYLLVGVVAGILAGLLGVGGGIIVVPALSLLFSHGLFSSTLVMHMAVGTSLAIMIFTAASSGYAYRRRNLVFWPLFWKLLPVYYLGTITGAIVAKHISSRNLTIAFAFFLILIAIRMFFSKLVKGRKAITNIFVLTIISFGVGMFSGFFGIGGGIIMVPFFIYCSLEIYKATGTSSICGFPLAIIGTLSLIMRLDSRDCKYAHRNHRLCVLASSHLHSHNKLFIRPRRNAIGGMAACTSVKAYICFNFSNNRR